MKRIGPWTTAAGLLVLLGATACQSQGETPAAPAAAPGTKAGTKAAARFESSPVGFARMKGGTKGGAGGKRVTVRTAAALARYATAKAPFVIRVNTTIKLAKMQRVASNKTIIGAGTAGRITGAGFTLAKARNVIIRNLTITGSKDDAINVQDGSRNIWIDHNDLSRAKDGLIDVKRGSDFVTVSWNRLHHHDKSVLLGHSDDNGSQDRGHLRVTYVHNWFDGTNQRHPRVRFANPVHVLNNYFSNIGSYGVASTTSAGVFVERNFFENVARPTVLGQGDSPAGNLKLLRNHFVKSGKPASRNPKKVAAIPYAYTPQVAAKVKATVRAGAGVGKI